MFLIRNLWIRYLDTLYKMETRGERERDGNVIRTVRVTWPAGRAMRGEATFWRPADTRRGCAQPELHNPTSSRCSLMRHTHTHTHWTRQIVVSTSWTGMHRLFRKQSSPLTAYAPFTSGRVIQGDSAKTNGGTGRSSIRTLASVILPASVISFHIT